jgi:hypothetical protein
MKESAARRKTITENGGKFDVADHKGPFGPSDEASAGALVNVPLTVDGVRLKHWGNWVVALNTISALGMAEATAANSKNLDRYEPIRQAIIEKNRLVFDQWRPQNETYLFGFRKHEQGQNAREVEMFTPLIQAADDRIAALKASLNSSGSDGRGKESKP